MSQSRFIELDDLFEDGWEFEVGDSVTIDLGDGVEFEFEVGAVDEHDGVVTVRGVAADGSEVNVSVSDVGATGNVWTEDGTYTLLPAEDGEVLVQLIDPAQVPIDRNYPAHGGADAPPDGPVPENAVELDLLVLFPTNVGAGKANSPYCGGKDSRAESESRKLVAVSVRDELDHALDDAAEVGRIAHACAEYTVTCTTKSNDGACIDRPLNWLRYGHEDKFSFGATGNSAIKAARDEAGADVVIMIIPVSYHAGAAYTLPEDHGDDPSDFAEEFAFLVVNHTFATSFHTLSHELGHVFGLRHDRPWYGNCDVGGLDTAKCNFGSIVLDEDKVARGFTIMATRGVCNCHLPRDGCESNRFHTYSGYKLRLPEYDRSAADGAPTWAFGSPCMPNQSDGPYNLGVDARQFLLRKVAFVSRYRDHTD